jgi:hypothetical protein
MSMDRMLSFAALAFGVLWIAGMYWWKSPMTTAGVVALVVVGTIAAAAWYGVMRIVMTQIVRPQR